MSVPFDPKIIAMRSDADLSALSWRAVKPNADNDIDKATAGDEVIGVLTDDCKDGSSTAAFNSVQVGGIVKVEFGGTVTAGNSVKSDADGKAVYADTDYDVAFGVAIESGALGDLGSVLFGRHTISVA